MAAIMAGAGAVLGMAGTLIGAEGEADALENAARADEENARRTELKGAIEGAQVRRDARASDGEAIVAAAANGAGLGGSAGDVLMQSAIEREYAVLSARYSAGSEAHDLRLQGKAKRKAARATRIGGLIKAGSQALSAASGAMGGGGAGGAKPSGSLQLPTPGGP